MCFSANASFMAAGVTGIAGIVALSGAKKTWQLLLGAIPLFFALHQAGEGFLWLGLTHDEHATWQRPAMFTFLVVAKVVWPILVPFAFLAAEEQRTRRQVLGAVAALGVVLAAALAYGLQAYPVSAAIVGRHIQYRLDSPLAFRWITDFAYAVVTVIPPLASSDRRMRLLGMLVLGSLIVSKIFFYETFISVWCFFAALISVMIVLIVKAASRATPSPRTAAS